MRHAPWPGAPRRLARTDPVLEAAHASRVERAWWAALWLLAALGYAWLVTGCATTSVQCSSLERGACTVSSTRFLTDSAVNLSTPDGTTLGFTSAPNQAGVSAAFGALGDVIKYLAPLAATGKPPTKPPVVVPPPPPPPPQALESPEP